MIIKAPEVQEVPKVTEAGAAGYNGCVGWGGSGDA
jgi:hypothetical protein